MAECLPRRIIGGVYGLNVELPPTPAHEEPGDPGGQEILVGDDGLRGSVGGEEDEALLREMLALSYLQWPDPPARSAQSRDNVQP